MKRQGLLLLVAGLLFFASPSADSFAQDADIREMKKQIEVLTEEMEKLKLGAVAEPKYESFMGLGPAASKVYGVEKGLSLGGYGEIVYENYLHGTKKDFADALRFVLYTGYKFNDWIVMNTELEFEHAGIKNVGGSTTNVTPIVNSTRQAEVYVEFMYLDFLLSKSFNVRTGLMLMPVGLVNELHEPTVFNGVLRPDVERNILPSTWRDIGIMTYGELGNLDYKLALVNGLRADRFSKGNWIRGGRQQGAEINADVWAGVARLDYEIVDALNVGGTYYFGRAGHGIGTQQDPLPNGIEKEATVSLWEVHADYQRKGLQLRGLYAKGGLDGNDALKAAPPGDVGKAVEGWYVEAAYDVMPFIKTGSEMSLTPFVRYESYDTHKEVFTGTRDPSQDRTVITAGLGFKPHSQVVLKADYQWRDTASTLPAGKGTGLDENKINQFNVGIGFIF